MRKIACLFLAIAAAVGVIRAQTSADYKLTESTLNAGGDPHDGSFAASANYRIRLDAIGQGLIGVGFSSASFHLGAGFVGSYPPPGEVQNLRWTAPTTLAWDPEKSVGSYDTYRGTVGAFAGYGSCFQSGLTTESAGAPGDPSPGQAYFYLVTAENLIEEEGTKGFTSSGVMRTNPSPCP